VESRKRLTEIWDCERFGVRSRKTGSISFEEYGLQNQNVIYTTTKFFRDAARVARPKYAWQRTADRAGRTDGTDDARLMVRPRHCRRRLAVQWKGAIVRSGKARTDLVDWVKFSNGSWKKDGKRIFLQSLTTNLTRKKQLRLSFTITNLFSTNSARPGSATN